jgi:hypothetical protein
MTRVVRVDGVDEVTSRVTPYAVGLFGRIGGGSCAYL